MKIPMSWLNDFVDIRDIDPKTFEEGMTMSGSKVEGITSQGADIKNVKTGKIVEITRHPDAEKLVICQIDINDKEQSELIQIVTGADNVFEGAIVPAALHRSTLPGGVKITKTKLRGVESYGMLCSVEELGIGTDADGIMILPNDTPIGIDIADALGMNENIVEFEITSNRPDCLSVAGLAREAAVTFERKLEMPIVPQEGNGTPCDCAEIKIEDFELCPRFTARVIKNVKIAPSPDWMQKRLENSGIRPINNIVDITNYVMLEYGQPMHAYDLDNVAGKTITVRRAKAGEQLETLDDVPRQLDNDMIVISDNERAIGVAGVMGGANTEVTDSTTTILLESAAFNPALVRSAAKKLNMRTEASLRFEKGLCIETVSIANNRACQLISELACGEVVPGMIDVRGNITPLLTLPLELERIFALLGISIAKERIIDILTKLGFSVANDIITVPSFRCDIESTADIAEEVARIYGYNNIPSNGISNSDNTPRMYQITSADQTPEWKFINRLRQNLSAQGFYEIITYSFENPDRCNLLQLPKDAPERNQVRISNPLGTDTSVMRTSMIPSMLDIVQKNLNKRNTELRLFEAGKVYIPKDGSPLPEEQLFITACIVGKDIDFYDIKGCAEELLTDCGLTLFTPANDDNVFHPGRCAKIYAGKTYLGICGQIHPQIARNFNINTEVYLLNLNTNTLLSRTKFNKQYKPLPKFPAVTRDISLTIDNDITAAQVEEIFAKNKSGIMEDYSLFDIYSGKQIEEGKKSMAYSLSFRDKNRTLTDDEVNAVMEKIFQDLQNKYKAELRCK